VNKIKILQISTSDSGGGADRIAYHLLRAYQAKGNDAWMAVGLKRTDDHHIFSINNDYYRGRWARLWLSLRNSRNPFLCSAVPLKGLRDRIYWIGQLKRRLKIQLGHEDFEFPGTWRILNRISFTPDIIHCHNLHGNYFDLRALPWLSHRSHLFLTLHDEWMFSGHCAYNFDCPRWKMGCGQCPDLLIYPSIRRDGTAYNWRRKRKIFSNSRIYVATPSRWLLDRAKESILSPTIVESKVINNGIDQSIFHPTDKSAIRERLGYSKSVQIILFAATGIRNNRFKDFKTIKEAIVRFAEKKHENHVICVALGEEAPAEHIGDIEIRFVPFQECMQDVACYFQMADLYIHAARTDNFPNTILEALSCELPVIATAVGGIPEQIRGLNLEGYDFVHQGRSLNLHKQDKATGFLVPPGDAVAMSQCIELLLKNDPLLQQLGVNAGLDARQRFDLGIQTGLYLNWFFDIINEQKGPSIA